MRGYEIGKGEFVILDPDEIEEAKPESASTIEVGDLVEQPQIDRPGGGAAAQRRNQPTSRRSAARPVRQARSPKARAA